MRLAARALASSTAMLLVLAVGMFLAAGTVAWPAGWASLVLFAGGAIGIGVMLWRRNPSLLRERLTFSKSTQPGWDKAFLMAFHVLFVAWLVLMPLDAVRWSWSRTSVWLQAVGALLLLSSLVLTYRSFKENSYLSPMVRLQEERGHEVVSTGLYRHVRHPLYMSTCLMLPGTALLLGSWYGLALAPLLIGMLALRAVFEERMLQRNLAGYADYTAQVRYRLIPRVW